MLVPNESAKFSLRMLASTAQPSLAASAGCFVTAGFGFVLNLFSPDAICAGCHLRRVTRGRWVFLFRHWSI